MIPLDGNKENNLYVLQSVFLETLNDFSSFNEEMLCCKGDVSLGGSVDTEGNKSIDLKIKGESEDGSFRWEGSGNVEQDSDGNTNGKIEGRISWNFYN